MYVQHRIREQAELVWEWIDRHNASVFIAGYINNCGHIIIKVKPLLMDTSHKGHNRKASI